MQAVYYFRKEEDMSKNWHKKLKSAGILILAFAFAFSLSACGEKDEAGMKMALTNGVIYTVDGEDWDSNPAEALVISPEGVVEYVGDAKEADELIDDNTEVIDLEGKTVLPGFIDSHVHPPGALLTELYNIDLYTAFNKKDTLDTIKEFVESHPDEEIYWGSGFNMGMVDEDGNPPSKEWLDEVCKDTPMILTSNDGHSEWLNSAALELCGIDATTTHKTGNVHKDANGEPTGLLTDAWSLIIVEQEFTAEQEAEALKAFIQRMHEWGYTAFWSAGHSVDFSHFIESEENGEFTMHASLSARMNPKDWKKSIEDADALKEEAEGCENIKVESAKFFADGVIEGVTGYLKEPYAAGAGKGSDYVSEPLWDANDMEAAMTKLMEKGYDVHVHSIGDAATEMTVDCIEAAQKANGDKDYRNTITHLQLVDDKEKERMAELNIIGSVQPFWHLKEPDWYDTVDELVLGKERAWTEYPLGSLFDAGIIVTSSGDYPVSPENNPFWAIEAGVTRNLNNADYYGVDDITDIDDPQWLLNPDERATVKQMIEAYTINGAYQMRSEDTIGSLAVGKSGDFIVIDKDILKIDPLELDAIKVHATIFEGKVVSGELK
jgi:predicted amidohydrolase YtcJ